MVDQLIPRPEIMAFAREMERRMAENDFRPGWQGSSVSYLSLRMREEAQRAAALALGMPVGTLEGQTRAQNIINHAVDAANYTMMLAIIAGGLEF